MLPNQPNGYDTLREYTCKSERARSARSHVSCGSVGSSERHCSWSTHLHSSSRCQYTQPAWLIELRFYVPLDTKYVISEPFFLARCKHRADMCFQIRIKTGQSFRLWSDNLQTVPPGKVYTAFLFSTTKKNSQLVQMQHTADFIDVYSISSVSRPAQCTVHHMLETQMSDFSQEKCKKAILTQPNCA